MSRTLKSKGSSATTSAKTYKCGAAKGIGTVLGEIVYSVPSDLLARTIAARPPNEDRIRGILA